MLSTRIACQGRDTTSDFAWPRAESSEEALELYEQALPVAAKTLRWIPTMFARNTRSRSIKRGIAHALFMTGSIEKARMLFLECDRILEECSSETTLCAPNMRSG